MKYLFAFLIVLNLLPLHILAQESKALDFIENKGQWDDNVKFMSQMQGGKVWISENNFTFDFVSSEDLDRIHERWHNRTIDDDLSDLFIRHHVYKVNFIAANSQLEFESEDLSSSYNNYFLGNDPSKWAGNVPLAKKVIAKSLYDGIDLITYSNDSHFKYDFIVHPGADPDQIELSYEGADIQLIFKELMIDLSIGKVYEHAPIAYQMIKGKRKNILCEYELNDNTLRFKFPKGYNRSYELIIDPELIFSTYTGSTADNWGFTATYDDDGNLYGGGIVFNWGYPTTTGAFEVQFSGGTRDIGITKYSPNGSSLVYSTYLGGSSSEDPHSLMVDSNGDLIVYGSTDSDDFPTTAGAYDESYNGGTSDIFVAKFNASGSDLLASTYLGGNDNDGKNNSITLHHNYGDDARGEVYIDENDNIYIASTTKSSDFPTTDDSEEQVHQGGQDACVIVFPPNLDNLIFSTFLGGSSDDAAYSIKEKENFIVVAGGTASTNFPTTADSFHPQYLGGSTDGFVLTLDSVGSIYHSSFIGTSAYDQVYFVEIDPDFHIFLTGQTEGAYPVSDDVFSNANGSQFVQEMNSELSLSILSTVFGTGGTGIDISLTAFLIDQCDHIYISGWGGIQGTGSTTGLPVTPDAYQSTTDGNDFYFIVFDKDFEGLLYATYFGGTGPVGEHVDGGTSRFDKNGIIYQAVCAGCGASDAFPTTPGAWSQTNGSTNCNLGTLKMEFDFQGISAEALVNDTTFCSDPPFLVDFYGSGESIPYHYWAFGDGQFSNQANPQHPYASAGIYDIEYIVIDSSTCNISDTAYASVEVIQKEVFSMSWDATPPSICDDTLFVNMSFTGSGADSLIWDMGDGTIYYDSVITHTYYVPGTYEATLTAYDFDCDEIGTESQTYILSENVISGQLEVPNIFSPNHDGLNDKFRLFYIDKPLANPLIVMEYYHVTIYNRWGRLVFESGDSPLDWEWDGSIDGTNADEGVYFYILLYNSPCEDEGTIRKTGFVTLVR